MTDLQAYTPDVSLAEPGYPGSALAWPQPLPPPPTASPIRRGLAALLRYKWLLTGAVLLGIAAALLAWRLINPNFRTQGSLWVSDDNRGTGPIAQAGLLQSSAWLDLLRSFSVLDPVVVAERLYLVHEPEDAGLFAGFRIHQDRWFRAGSYRLAIASDGGSYTLRTTDGLTVETAKVGAPIGVELGFEWAPPVAELTAGREAKFQVMAPRDAAVELRTGIEMRIDPLGTFIQLGYRHPDPEQSARVLESVMQRTVDLARDLKRNQLDEANRILGEQLGVVEEDLRAAERDLESFRIQTITLPTDQASRSVITPGLAATRGPVYEQYFAMRMEMEAVRQDRERLEQLLAEQNGGGLNMTALELIPSLRVSSQMVRSTQQLAEAQAVLSALSERYTDEHQAVRDARARVERLVSVEIPQAVQAVLTQLRARETELSAAVAGRGTQLEQIPPRVIEEARLERRVRIANDLYVGLQARYETSSLASRSSAPDLQILDRPVIPSVPEIDERARWAVMTFGLIFGTAVGLVLLFDRLDPRLRDPFDITDKIGLPILGAVPHLKAGGESENQVREAFRELRVNLEYAHGAVRPLVLCVSSPAEREGKTFVSTNLAIAFAGLGRRTLLVDADTRRGNAHELLQLARRPGLTDFLIGTHEGPAHLQETAHENLWLLSSGARRSGSPELLNSRAMQDLLASARRRFDVIIVDSPPLSAGADAFVLAALAGSLTLVLRSGSTKKDLATAKLEPLLRLPVRILGAVLNDFVPSSLYGGYRYYGEYIKGYEARDEVATESVVSGADTWPPALNS